MTDSPSVPGMPPYIRNPKEPEIKIAFPLYAADLPLFITNVRSRPSADSRQQIYLLFNNLYLFVATFAGEAEKERA